MAFYLHIFLRLLSCSSAIIFGFLQNTFGFSATFRYFIDLAFLQRLREVDMDTHGHCEFLKADVEVRSMLPGSSPAVSVVH